MKSNDPLPTYPSRWTTRSSTVTYRNPWITVREDQVIRPDGNEGIYGVVESRIATAVVALNQRGKVYLVGQYRYPTEIYSWEVVEGGSDGDERPIDAVRRELKEEAGLQAATWMQLGAPVYLSNCFSAEIAYVFLATDLSTAIGEEGDPTEDLKVLALPFSDVMRRVASGEISDALSIIALQRAAAFLPKSLFFGAASL